MITNDQIKPMSVPYIDEKIIKFLKYNKNQKILDIACGQGYLGKKIFSLGYKNIYCADIDKNNFKLDKNKFNFLKIDCNSTLPYENNFFDTVITSETIEHLENPRKFLKELNRILKNNGVLILTTPNIETIFSRIYFLFTGGLAGHTKDDYFISGHKAILTDWIIRQFAKEADFKFISKTYNCAYIPIFKIKLRKILLNKMFGWILIYKFIKK